MEATLKETGAMVEHLAEVNVILDRNDYDPQKLIPILQQVQEHYKFLSKEVIKYVANSLKIPPSQVYGVATFYAHFALEPKGKYIFKLCDGTACHVKGSQHILDALYDKLSLSEEKPTSDDMLFTVETVSCLGACGLAPVMLVNDKVYGQVTPEQAHEIIEEVRKTEAAATKED